MYKARLPAICVLGASFCVAAAAIDFWTRAIVAPAATGYNGNLRTSRSNCFVGSASSTCHRAGGSKVLDGTVTARHFFAGDGEGPAKQQQRQQQQVQTVPSQPPTWVLAVGVLTGVGAIFAFIYLVTFISAAVTGVSVITAAP